MIEVYNAERIAEITGGGLQVASELPSRVEVPAIDQPVDPRAVLIQLALHPISQAYINGVLERDDRTSPYRLRLRELARRYNAGVATAYQVNFDQDPDAVLDTAHPFAQGESDDARTVRSLIIRHGRLTERNRAIVDGIYREGVRLCAYVPGDVYHVEDVVSSFDAMDARITLGALAGIGMTGPSSTDQSNAPISIEAHPNMELTIIHNTFGGETTHYRYRDYGEEFGHLQPEGTSGPSLSPRYIQDFEGYAHVTQLLAPNFPEVSQQLIGEFLPREGDL